MRNMITVVIEDYAKIYSSVTILGGVTIEKQGIIGACSLVNRDVRRNTVVVGTPARELRNRRNLNRNGEELTLRFG